MSQSRSKYQAKATNLNRVNPQFVGIAQKYSQHKRRRLESEDKRKRVSSNYVYARNFNQSLEKNLQQKQKQLQKLQAIRKRHHEDIQNKIEKDERRKKEISNLRNKCQAQRINLKKNIKEALDHQKADKFIAKLQTKKMLNSAQMQFQATTQRSYNEQCMRHHSIELSKKIGQQRVNNFYKTQNMKSLNNYRQMIDQQDKKSDENNQQINHMNKKIKKLEINIDKKQKKLKNVLDQISLYSVQTPNQRKVHHLASTTVYGWGFSDNSSSVKKKNRLGTASSNRSRPSDILRKSFAIDKQHNGYNSLADATI